MAHTAIVSGSLDSGPTSLPSLCLNLNCYLTNSNLDTARYSAHHQHPTKVDGHFPHQHYIAPSRHRYLWKSLISRNRQRHQIGLLYRSVTVHMAGAKASCIEVVKQAWLQCNRFQFTLATEQLHYLFVSFPTARHVWTRYIVRVPFACLYGLLSPSTHCKDWYL